MKMIKPTPELMPCPFCGSKDIKTDLKGTQPSISCNDCGDGFVSIQTSDHFTDEERFNDPDFQFRYAPHFDYGVKGTQRALDVLTERWNTRHNADRLAELDTTDRVAKAYEAAKVLAGDEKIVIFRIDGTTYRVYQQRLGKKVHKQKERIAELEAALDHAMNLSVPEWQPIKTAPRDGTVILLHFPNYPEDMYVGYWDKKKRVWRSIEGLSLHRELGVKAVYWMPKPQALQHKGEGSDA